MKHIIHVVLFLLFSLYPQFQVHADVLFLNQGPVDLNDSANVLSKMPDHLADLDYFVVQLRGPVLESQKEKIRTTGAEILSYIPNNGFIIRMSPQTMKKIKSLSFVKGLIFFKQHYRISPLFRSTTIFNSEEKLQLLVEFFPGENVALVLEKLKKNGARILDVSDHLIRVSGTRMSLYFLEHLKSVSWLEEDIEFGPVAIESPENPFDGLSGYEMGHKILDSNKLHDLGFSGSNEIIGYSDTGLDIGINDETLHRDFMGKIRSAYAFKDASWKDTWGHGTHVAGILAGNGKLSDGVIKASAFNAQLVVQSLLVGNKFHVPIQVGESLLAPAYNDGARVHSNSWGSSVRWGSYNPYSKSVDKFIWEHPDMLNLFAAGNSAGDYNKDGIVDEGSILIPGTAKNCLTVGASENLVSKGGVQVNWQWLGVKEERWHVDPVASDLPSDHPDGIAAFSSRGPTRDGRIKPDVVAPGTNILSTKTHVEGSKELWGPFNDDYIWAGGSSMATPMVASGVALIREYLIKHEKIASPSSALLKALVINGAVELFPGQFGDIEKKEIPKRRPNVQEGWGRFNVANAVLENEKRNILTYDETTGLATSEEKEYLFEIIHSEESIAITLVYNDFPGALSTTKYLVNDLDLEAIESEGNTYFPNGLAQKDDRNNVEGIDILKPQKGPLKVKIKAFNVPEGKNGKQPYTLVVSGGVIEAAQKK